jgi:hypothetical protein
MNFNVLLLVDGLKRLVNKLLLCDPLGRNSAILCGKINFTAGLRKVGAKRRRELAKLERRVTFPFMV